MPIKRHSFTGVTNIIRFNWHQFVIAFAFAAFLLLASLWLEQPLRLIAHSVIGIILLTIGISLGVSHYIYDRSELNSFKWLHNYMSKETKHIVNIHAGFDESSQSIQAEFPDSILTVFDFFDPESPSEISIRRARKHSSDFQGTISIQSGQIPLEDNSTDTSLVILSAHELRSPQKRIAFLKEINRITHQNGSVIIVEHLRDFSNFTAFTFGFFHFYSKREWMKNFAKAGLSLESEQKLTPFISVFRLKK